MGYGDDEHPISFRFEPTHEGGHVHVKVWAGLAGMRGNCGTIVMRPEDFAVLRLLLDPLIAEPVDHVAYETGGGSDGRQAWTMYRIHPEPFEFGEFDADAARAAGRIP